MTTTYKKSFSKTPSHKSISLVGNRKFYLIDASDLILGRLSSFIANLLMGKNESIYTPHSDTGSFVVVINSDKVKFTSNKLKTKKYWRHTGYPGGIKCTTPEEFIRKGQSSEIIKKAIYGMLPKNRLRDVMIRNLRIYNSDSHSHQAQNPIFLDFGLINRKNKISS